MTNEEAEQLIAEINKFYTIHYGESDSKMFMPDLEKIIKRFANRPPEEGYILKIGGDLEFGEITLQSASHDNKYVNIWIDSRNIRKFRILADYNDLTKLRDNCTKMLEWLEWLENDNS